MKHKTDGLERENEFNSPAEPAALEIVSENDLWRQFTEAATSHEFCGGWLSLQCFRIERVKCALVLLGPSETGPFTPSAVWPDPDFDVNHLVPVAEQAIRERRGVIIKNEEDGTAADPAFPAVPGDFYVAYPLEVSGKIHGVIVLHLENRTDEEIQRVAKQLHWGAGWIEVLLRRLQDVNSERANDRFRTVLDSIAVTLEQEHFKPAAMALVTKIATMLVCDRVSLGFKEGGKVVIRALSHSSEFSENINLMRAIASAMEEALDQQEMIILPPPPNFPAMVTREHEDLMRQYGMGAICTVPLGSDGRFWGALTIEFAGSKKLSEPEIELIKSIASVAGPVLELKKKADRSLAAAAGDSFKQNLRKVIGPSHLALKSLGLIAAALIAVLSFVEGEYRAKATTILEGSIQRVISAPFSGFIFEAHKRAGDLVKKGDLLCRLDDKELRLEYSKYSAQDEQLQKEYRGAMAKHDPAQIKIIGAKINQTRAQLNLLSEQLSRTKMVAPFDGIVTSGDLSHAMGSPVEKGQVLFEVAPLDSYRVILQVDEREIDLIKVGQHGELLLPSLSGEEFPLRVSAITPVSSVKDGRNFFRVEAQLERASDRLRPGMEGVGKVYIGERKLVWIWTHEIINWLRLKLWSWSP